MNPISKTSNSLIGIWLMALVTMFAANLVNADELLDMRKISELRQQVFPLKKRINQSYWDSMTNTQKEALIAYLHRGIEELRRDGFGAGAGLEAQELAILGDSEGASLIAIDYLVNPSFGGEILLSVNSPQTIGFIGEGLFKNEPPFRSEGDLDMIAAQEATRDDILKLLVRTGAFNDEVVSWAKRMQTERPVDPDGVKIMREWFKANETALKSFNFREVKPGAEPVRKVKNVISGGNNNEASGQQPNVPLRAQFPTQEMTAIAPHSIAKNSWAWVAVAIAAILGAVVFYLFQRQRTKR